MKNTYKPNGYSSVSPYIVVKGAQKMIDLLKDIFQAQELRRYDSADGSIMHAEVKIDDSVIMLADASDTYPPNQSLIHVYVPDSRKAYAKAIELGCEGMEEPVNKEGDPDIRGMFRDFQGNMWAVGTQVNTAD